MENRNVAMIAVAIALLVGGTGVLGYTQGWLLAPHLTVELVASWPDGSPLERASISARGQEKGETDSEGKLSFQLGAGIGEEVAVSASLDRDGMEFEPWEDSFVVRRWDRGDPETLRYALAAVLEPRTVAARVEVRSGDGPVVGAVVQVGGKTLGKTDDDGQLKVDLRRRTSRSAKVSVKARGFNAWSQQVTLRGGETLIVDLDAPGAPSSKGRATAAYESLGRVVRVRGAEVRLGRRKLGKIDGFSGG